MQKKTTCEIFYENLNRYLQAHPNNSMNNLSREIGANKGYIQKMTEQQGTPSFEKMDLICESLNIEVWKLFQNHTEVTLSPNREEAINIVHSLPESAIPTALGILKVLQQADFSETR